jgi:hypothetical protein
MERVEKEKGKESKKEMMLAEVISTQGWICMGIAFGWFLHRREKQGH